MKTLEIDATTFEQLNLELDLLDTEYLEFNTLLSYYQKHNCEGFKLEQKCFKQLHHQAYRLAQIEKAAKRIDQSSVEDALLKEKIFERMKKRKLEIEKSSKILPQNNGLYLKVILGKVNVNVMDQELKFKYKEEYERFKLCVNAFIFLLALLDILFNYRVIDALLHFLLVWYHCTLTIRESILVVNGSRIKGWWRTVQFITGIKAGIMIVWPDGTMYDLFRNQFLNYIVYISFLQFLQFYYQHNCLYRLRTLGERYDMDITIQGFHSWMWKGLGFLLPFLYLGYLFQLYNSYTLFKLSQHPLCIEWQVPVSGFIFLMLFCGNTFTTSLVIKQKFKEKWNYKRLKDK